MIKACRNVTIAAPAIVAAILVTLASAPAHAALSCHDFTRAYVLGDQDVVVRAVAIARPWFDASQVLLETGKTAPKEDQSLVAARVWSLMLLSQLASDCEDLPDDTVDGIVATHLKTTQRQLAEIAARTAATDQNATSAPSTRSGSGNAVGNDTAALSPDQRGAIGDHVRECWTRDAGALDIDRMRVLLTVTTDAGGVARKAEVAGDDVGRLGDPRFRAFAEKAVRAIMDRRCANLPLPRNVLGRPNVVTFRFSP